MLRFVRSCYRILLLVSLFAYGVLSLLIRRPRTRAGRAEWLHHFSILLLRSLGITALQRGTYPASGAVISNHMGYLDIITFAALHRCVFVAKSDIASWPVIGWMTTMSGTVYVERGRGGSAQRAQADLAAVSQENVPIVFFPEGTSSDGSAVLPFRSGLLANCLAAGQSITAACVRYRLTRDNGPGVAIGTSVAYWDDTPLPLHIFRLLGLRGIEIEVTFSDAPIAFSPAALSDRHIAAAEARTAVLQLRGVADA
jgi:lyso-ornithine lipid O-acyltransferase